jgi:predicted nucleotidyltransferase
VTLLEEIAAEVERDPESLGLILHGSRAAGVHGAEPDYDLVRVVTDASCEGRRARGELREKRAGAATPAADVVYSSPGRLRARAESPDGYTSMFVTARVVADTDGTVGSLVETVVTRAGELARERLDDVYDDYLNSFVRSLKSWRRGDELGGRLHAAESCLHLVKLLFAAERRWPPYHDQLRPALAELEVAFGWEEGFLAGALLDVVATGDATRQQQLELRVEALLESRGIPHQWGPEDDLVPMKAHRFA